MRIETVIATAALSCVVSARLDQARRSLPSATFVRGSDGDGAALVEVTLPSNARRLAAAHSPNHHSPNRR